MILIFNIIVLLFEVLYYSLFMKFARNEGKIEKYFSLFGLITIFFYFVGTNQIYSYLLLIVMILYGLKYIIKIKVSLYDMLVILIMLFLKVIIELPFILILFQGLKINQFLVTIIFDLAKIFLLLGFRNKMNKCYKSMKKLWDNNHFYIRYIFSCSVFVYVILTIILLIKLAWEV